MDGKSLTPQQIKLVELNNIPHETFSEGKVDWKKVKEKLVKDNSIGLKII